MVPLWFLFSTALIVEQGSKKASGNLHDWLIEIKWIRSSVIASPSKQQGEIFASGS
jgi:hypothetical protein